MTLPASGMRSSTLGLRSLEQYESLIGAAAIERILSKAERVRTLHSVHISSTFYGGGVTEILTPLTLLMNAIGLETGWRMIQGTPAFFLVTKKIHNALQGEQIELTESERAVYEQVIFENAASLHIEEADTVIVHDPQPLLLINHFPDRDMPWLWQGHVDLSCPNPAVWDYLRGFVERYNAAIFSLPEYAQKLQTDQRFIMPAIDPFSIKNRDMSEAEIS